jgi:hypothetical protein
VVCKTVSFCNTFCDYSFFIALPATVSKRRTRRMEESHVVAIARFSNADCGNGPYFKAFYSKELLVVDRRIIHVLRLHLLLDC